MILGPGIRLLVNRASCIEPTSNMPDAVQGPEPTFARHILNTLRIPVHPATLSETEAIPETSQTIPDRLKRCQYSDKSSKMRSHSSEVRVIYWAIYRTASSVSCSIALQVQLTFSGDSHMKVLQFGCTDRLQRKTVRRHGRCILR